MGRHDGTVFTDFLAQLNDCTDTTEGFAGHCDWRLPTIAELQTILLAPHPCGASPCIDPVFGATNPAGYWSGTNVSGDRHSAWWIDFETARVRNNPAWKDGLNSVRAVRTAP